MQLNQQSRMIAELVHQNSIEILTEVGFCAPEESLLLQLSKAGFIVNHETSMVRITRELLDTALKTLPKDGKLVNRTGSEGLDFDNGSKLLVYFSYYRASE